MKQYEYKIKGKATKGCYIRRILEKEMMNILEYGMKYKNSSSKMRRIVAKCILEIEKRRADHCEARMNRKQKLVSQNSEEAAAMLRSIRDQIAQMSSEEAGECEMADPDQDAVSG